MIDDNATTNFLHERLLRNMGLCDQIRVFENGKKAFDYLYNVCNKNYDVSNKDYFQPELILLDINMPVMGGFAFLDLYNKFEECFRDKILLALLTNSDDPQDKEVAEKYGVHYLSKPLTQDKIFHLLEQKFSLPTGIAA